MKEKFNKTHEIIFNETYEIVLNADCNKIGAKICLQKYIELSGNDWIYEEPEIFYRYKYELMTYGEWNELFDKGVKL